MKDIGKIIATCDENDTASVEFSGDMATLSGLLSSIIKSLTKDLPEPIILKAIKEGLDENSKLVIDLSNKTNDKEEKIKNLIEQTLKELFE